MSVFFIYKSYVEVKVLFLLMLLNANIIYLIGLFDTFMVDFRSREETDHKHDVRILLKEK